VLEQADELDVDLDAEDLEDLRADVIAGVHADVFDDAEADAGAEESEAETDADRTNTASVPRLNHGGAAGVGHPVAVAEEDAEAPVAGVKSGSESGRTNRSRDRDDGEAPVAGVKAGEERPRTNVERGADEAPVGGVGNDPRAAERERYRTNSEESEEERDRLSKRLYLSGGNGSVKF
jgi:hypothetical protein